LGGGEKQTAGRVTANEVGKSPFVISCRVNKYGEGFI
jgi:hypothetical protein